MPYLSITICYSDSAILFGHISEAFVNFFFVYFGRQRNVFNKLEININVKSIKPYNHSESEINSFSSSPACFYNSCACAASSFGTIN